MGLGFRILGFERLPGQPRTFGFISRVMLTSRVMPFGGPLVLFFGDATVVWAGVP